MQGKQNPAKTSDALGIGQALRRNEKEECEPGGRQLEKPELSAL